MWYWSIYLVNKYFFKRKKVRWWNIQYNFTVTFLMQWFPVSVEHSSPACRCETACFYRTSQFQPVRKVKVDSRNLFGQISNPCFTLNLMCSISCSMSFDDGSEFFSEVSAGLRQVLSKSLTAVRLESLASSTWRMEEGEAGCLVFTARSFSASKLSTPWSRPWIVFSVWISSAPGKMSFSFVSACLSSSLLNASIPTR